MVLCLNVWNKELLTFRNFFVVTKKFLKAKFDCNCRLCIRNYLLYVSISIKVSQTFKREKIYYLSFLCSTQTNNDLFSLFRKTPCKRSKLNALYHSLKRTKRIFEEDQFGISVIYCLFKATWMTQRRQRNRHAMLAACQSNVHIWMLSQPSAWWPIKPHGVFTRRRHKWHNDSQRLDMAAPEKQALHRLFFFLTFAWKR